MISENLSVSRSVISMIQLTVFCYVNYHHDNGQDNDNVWKVFFFIILFFESCNLCGIVFEGIYMYCYCVPENKKNCKTNCLNRTLSGN